ncbi:MAG: ABC transporter permease subunit [Rhodospirillales bacterium]|jgi:putative spermidine/putrescine transport system permease protein|nr:ABC transporter permease subunit [Rhodospirillales bacterium]
MAWRERAADVIFVGPFLLFALAFLVVPSLGLFVQAVTTGHGFSLAPLATLWSADHLTAFRNSIEVSVLSALVGTAAGAVGAWLTLAPGMPRWARALISTFSAVAANFAGVPLAFAFISTLGTLGVITGLLKAVGIDIYAAGFSLFRMEGLVIVYAYFQIPLMLIVITPALEGLRREWREAAEGLGASTWQFWRHVGLPVLLPSLLSAAMLLFGNAFSAYATPYALTAGNLPLVTIDISNVLSGNVSLSPAEGAALACGMIVVMAAVMVLYGLLARRVGKWRVR